MYATAIGRRDAGRTDADQARVRDTVDHLSRLDISQIAAYCTAVLDRAAAEAAEAAALLRSQALIAAEQETHVTSRVLIEVDRRARKY